MGTSLLLYWLAIAVFVGILAQPTVSFGECFDATFMEFEFF